MKEHTAHKSYFDEYVGHYFEKQSHFTKHPWTFHRSEKDRAISKMVGTAKPCTPIAVHPDSSGLFPLSTESKLPVNNFA